MFIFFIKIDILYQNSLAKVKPITIKKNELKSILSNKKQHN